MINNRVERHLFYLRFVSDLRFSYVLLCIVYVHLIIINVLNANKNNWCILYFIFFKLGFTPCKAEQPPIRHVFTRKRSTYRLKNTGNLFSKNLQLKDVC